MAIITAVGNRKGGVGKTAEVLGVATGLMLMRRKVLVIDLDPQADASTALEAEGDLDVFDVLYGGVTGSIGEAITKSSWTGIDVVRSSEALFRMETESLMGAEVRLKTVMWESPELAEYDHILIDLPPALGRLTVNGLLAATQVLVVTEPTSFAVRGVGEFLDTVRQVTAMPHLNPSLKTAGIVVNKTSSPLTSEHSFQLEELRAAYGDLLVEPYLPTWTAMQDSASARVPLTKLSGRRPAILTERFVAHARHLEGVAK
ncbi:MULTISPECIES: ParA family protein [Rathayibacter]|uniref:ParA family protein n=1 Tax=Rathayibacter TaxID=33886 RepID=UPI001F41A751|nr:MULTISPECIES: AAA family ATPase [Rathayibacter]